MQNIYDHEWITIDGNAIHKTAIIHPCVKLGTGNQVGPYAVIGSNGEIRNTKYNEFKGTVEIGNNNVISEFVSIQRPKNEGQKTFIGNNNIIMAHSHIGHDVTIGSGNEICTHSIIGGHVTIGDSVKIKLNCTIRNRITIGIGATIGMCSNVIKDVEPNTTVYGNPAK